MTPHGLKAGLASVLLGGALTISAAPSRAAKAEQPVEQATVEVGRATAMPPCSSFVDAAATGKGAGTVQKPHRTIADAVASAKAGAVICVAEGLYREQIKPGEKPFTLAGGFQRGFKLRDSAAHVSKAQGKGGSFLRIADIGPAGDQATVIDGFEITGYSQAIYRDFYEPQRFDITNNYIHDNVCADDKLVGAGFTLNNVSGTIRGNVFRKNACGRGGAGALNDDSNKNTVRIENNLIEENAGVEPGSSHGGALYLQTNTLVITGNRFVGNSVTQWGAGLYVTAYPEGNQPTTAKMSGNVYIGNRAGNAGGGFFCDGGAKCASDHELFDGNCGANVYVDSGSDTSGPTVASFDHITNINARAVGCEGPGVGVRIDIETAKATDRYDFKNSIFWGNAEGLDFGTGCNEACKLPKVSVASSMAQTKFGGNGLAIAFGKGMVAPADPLFVAAQSGDYRLKAGSPAIVAGAPLGAFGVDDGGPAAGAAPSPPQEADVAPAPEAEAPVAARELEEPAPAGPEATTAAPEPERNPAAAVAANNPENDVTARQAFEEAKQLGTAEGWNVFLATFPKGFYADLARAYLKRLDPGASPAAQALPPPPPAAAPVPDEPVATTEAPVAPVDTTEPPAASAPAPVAETPATEAPAAQAPAAPVAAAPPPAAPVKVRQSAVGRGVKFFGFPEKFNRYYTDGTWKPSRTIFVGPTGGGDGATRETPMSPKDAVAAAKPGTKLHFTRGSYQACLSLEKENGGTYDDPVVLYGERNEDQSLGVSIKCCATGRQACFNVEPADYVAIDGFEMVGGKYGVRAVGTGYAASEHLRGLAVLNNRGHDQDRDSFFSGAADWAVWEDNAGHDAKIADGHGFYLSNGGDWNIVRFNETWGNARSNFQINPDPNSTCKEVGIPFADPRCDAFAGTGEGGQGASDYFLVEGNYFHHDLTNGPNFTSTRRSVIRNNVMGFVGTHNVSFWQETDNPKLGASENRILHNLFISTGKHGVKFANSSTRNLFANNIVVGVTKDGAANPSALLVEVDETSGGAIFASNLYASGKLEGRTPTAQETLRPDFSPEWFAKFPAALNHDVNDFAPAVGAPFLGTGALSSDAAVDINGVGRPAKPDLGPIEAP